MARHLLYFNTCHKVHFGNRSGLKEKESSSSRKHLDNCLLRHEKQLEVSGSREREGGIEGGGGRCGSAVCVECKRREGTARGEEGSMCSEVTRGGERAWPSAALEGGRGGEQSARGKAIVGLLGDHKGNKKSQYNDFSRKVQFGEINLKQLLVIKTPESVKSLSCASPCYTVGKAFRHVDGQVHYVDTYTHTQAYKLLQNHQRLLYSRHICIGRLKESVFGSKIRRDY